jgi:hypothetical protein
MSGQISTSPTPVPAAQLSIRSASGLHSLWKAALPGKETTSKDGKELHFSLFAYKHIEKRSGLVYSIGIIFIKANIMSRKFHI